MLELLPVAERAKKLLETVIVGYIEALSPLFAGEMRRELYIYIYIYKIFLINIYKRLIICFLYNIIRLLSHYQRSLVRMTTGTKLILHVDSARTSW